MSQRATGRAGRSAWWFLATLIAGLIAQLAIAGTAAAAPRRAARPGAAVTRSVRAFDGGARARVRLRAASPVELALARRALARAARADHAHSLGSVGDRIASIALSQVGVTDTPASTSFAVDCDPYTTLDGPPYDAPSDRGCGYDRQFGVENENEEWCADFADWVFKQAGITTDMGLIDPAASSFYAWGAKQGQPLTVDGTDPQVGDAVVFYEPGAITATTPADHVGIVTGVNPDGTVNLVDGDFLGSTQIGVEYDPNVDLATWASQVWSPGEQWVFVAPPTGAQPATPTATVSGPHVVATGTQTTFHASAQQAGGPVTSYAWSFAEGNGVPLAIPTGATVHHVFTDPGRVTVTMIATSSLGTIAVTTFNVDVVSRSSSVASTPNETVYYNPGPIAQRQFSVSAAGALTEESFDGASWLDESLPGAWSANTPVTTLDDKVDGTLAPHVFGRAASGELQEASLDGTAWTLQDLAGFPAAGSPVVAADVAPAGADGSTPMHSAVFFFDGSGRLTESSDPRGTWITSTVPGARGDHGLAIGTVTVAARPVVTLYTTTPAGRLVALSQRGGSWIAVPVASALRAAAGGGGLAAIDSGGAGQPAVFFLDRAGHVAAATPGASGLSFTATEISGQRLASVGGLQAGESVSGTGAVVPEVAALSPAGTPVLIAFNGGQWSSQALPGTATSLLGLAAYPIPGASQQLLIATATGPQADSAPGVTGPWTATPLPTAAATFPDRILLYGADAADLQAAQAAAAAAGLPASQVTGDFATAWAAGVSDDYLVIAVGQAANAGLYFNPCGWANPSGVAAGSTPFENITHPIDTLPGAGFYVQALGATSADTQSLASDLAYDAVHGALPSGVTSLPTQTTPAAVCSGSPS